MKYLFFIIRICLSVALLAFLLTLSVSADKVDHEVEKYIAEGISLRLRELYVYEFKCGKERIFEAIDRVMKSNPRLYFVENSFYYTTDDVGIVEKIIPTYLYSPSEMKNIEKFFESEIERILFSLNDNMSDLQKALALHEYLCENYEYDNSLKSTSMYDLLFLGKGTCQAFTLTYMELLERIGIDASYAYSNEIMHIWNLVKLDGEWYHVDVTWDNIESGVSHKNFLLNDREILESGHRGFINADGIECRSEKYIDGALHDTKYKYVSLGEGLLFVDNMDRTVYFDALDGNGKMPVYRIDELWVKGEGRYYATSFSSPVQAGNKVYFNTKDGIMEIDEKLAPRSVLELDFTAYGLTESFGVMCYTDKNFRDFVGVSLSKSFDADGDGEGTVLDLAALCGHLGLRETFVYKYNCDANSDYKLDGADLDALVEHLLIDKST